MRERPQFIRELTGVFLARRQRTLRISFLIAAVFVLAMLVASAPDVRAQDSAALAHTGIAAIEDERFGDALDAFTSASSLQPNEVSLAFGAGVAAFMLGQNDLAQSQFERAIAIKPEYLPAAMWLGDLHHRAGRLRQAIATYERAERHAPGDRLLRSQLTNWRKELALQSRFLERRTEHFRAWFENGSDEPRVQQVLERLEAAYWRVGATLGVFPSQPITVVLYSRKQFEDITKLKTWSVAAYDGQIRIPLRDGLDDRDELDRIVSHELVHAVVAMVGGRTVPAWVNEGLATALERRGVEEARATLAQAGARRGLASLHRSFTSLSKQDAAIAYASSADAVRRLIDQRGAPAIVGLLQDLSRGTPFATAFHQRLDMRYEDFAAQIARE